MQLTCMQSPSSPRKYTSGISTFDRIAFPTSSPYERRSTPGIIIGLTIMTLAVGCGSRREEQVVEGERKMEKKKQKMRKRTRKERGRRAKWRPHPSTGYFWMRPRHIETIQPAEYIILCQRWPGWMTSIHPSVQAACRSSSTYLQKTFLWLFGHLSEPL